MTTMPKAPKYHTKRRQVQYSSDLDTSTDLSEASIEDQIAAIRSESLTGRQLRMARRIAQRHGLTPGSDYDAVRQLRARGIDPFKRSNLLELVVPDKSSEEKAPATVARAYSPAGDFLPSTEILVDEARSRHIRQIQRDIARRRRIKLAGLVARLVTFILLPTILIGYYFFKIATPMYATHSQMSIKQATPMGVPGGLLAGTILATTTDSIDTQGYLQSLEAMIALDQKYGFKDHFSGENIDFLKRLPPDATNTQAHDTYSNHVKISFDQTEGVIRMEVIAADPETSATWSHALIALAEEKVDKQSLRLREDQMKGARSNFEESEQKMLAAQQRVIDLQEQFNVISADVEVSLLTSRIAGLEQQLTQDQLTLEEMLANPRPNMARVEPLQRRIETLENTIAGLRSELTVGRDNSTSLARIGSELQIAQVDLETRRLMMQESLQQLESARVEANRQTLYLSTGISPIPPDEPTYPRAFENTLVAFLIFCGIYLMLSLTVSILREQVSS